jgi:hypothetical protein
MADQEIIKHTKKVYKIWHSEEHTFKQKVKEFLFEIFIIVFAVSLSIWLHSWSEQRHQQEEANVFLNDLKSDLIENNEILEQVKKEFTFSEKAFRYFLKKKKNIDLNNDSINKYISVFENNIKLTIQDSQYEGYKYSGKLNRIEDKVLAKNIIEFYQKDLKTLLLDYYENKKFLNLVQPLIMKQIEISDNNTILNINKILDQNSIKIYFAPLESNNGIVENIDICIKKSNKIITQIDNLKK